MFKHNTTAGIIRTAAATACAVAAIAAAAPAGASNDGTGVVTYGDAGSWTVQRVNEDGKFHYCRAGLKFENGIQVFMLGFQKGWMVQFFNKAWPERAKATFKGSLQVDGRTLRTRANNWRGKSVFMGVGLNVSAMAPLMRGNVMSVVTAAGTSNFSLKGSSLAIKMTAQCRAEGMAEMRSQRPAAEAPVASRGAFGERPQAKAAPRVQPTSKRYTFNHDQTLAHAKGYLGKTPHTIIAPDKNVFKHFPVNWTTKSGITGGMMIVANTTQSIDEAMKTMTGDNARLCKGKALVAETFKAMSPVGEKVTATTTCQMQSGLRVLTFSVIQRAPKTLMIIVEGYFQSAAPKTAGTAQPKMVGA